MTIQDTLKKIPRPVLVAIVALLIGYGFGRYSAPKKVVTQTHETVREVVKQDTQAQEQIRALAAQVESLKKDTHRVVITRVLPNGTRTTRVEVDTHVREHAATHSDVAQAVTVHTATQADTTHAKMTDKIVERSASSWHAGVLAYVDSSHLRNLSTSFSAGLYIGKSFGPFEIDLSATVPVVRPVSLPVVGLSIGVGF